MSSDSLNPDNTLPLAIRFSLKQLCLRFQEACRSGEEPPLERYLAEVAEAHQAALLTELLPLELEQRRERGGVPRLEGYTQRFPLLAEVVRQAFSRLAVSGADTFALPGHVPPPHREGEAPAEPTVGSVGALPSLPPETGSPAIPGFEVLEVLGRGGMGVVYKARQKSLNRLVALKMIRTSGPDRLEERLRFRMEAEAVAQLGHGNIVQVYESGEHHGQPYLVLELIEGGSLDQHVGQPLPPRAGAELIETLARAVHHAHSHGIIHRDLKPANILLQAQETPQQPHLFRDRFVPKIADFGLAKRIGIDSEQTQAGHVVGTPAYMAPEQASGDRNLVGPTVDIYALGVILYQLLTGRTPVEGKFGLDVLLLVQVQEPPPPRRFQPNLPRDLETICLKCLRKEPGQRYATAQDLAADLRCFLSGEPIQARPVGAVERAWKWTRRNPVPAALLGAVTLLVLAVAVISTTAAFRLQQKQDAIQQAEKDRTKALVDALLTAAPDSVPVILNTLAGSQEFVVPLLREELEDSRKKGESRRELRRLRAAIALTVLGEPHLEFLLDAVPTAPAAESGNLALAFRKRADEAGPLLSERARKSGKLTEQARYAILLLDLGDLQVAQEMLAEGPDPTPRGTLIDLFQSWHGDLSALPAPLRRCDDEACRSGLCAALGRVDPATLSSEVHQELADVLSELYREAAHGGTHSAADWALRQWKEPLPTIEPTRGPPRGRRWFVNREGLTMIELAPGVVTQGATVLVLTRPFFLSNREVSLGLFRRFLEKTNDPRLKQPDWRPKDIARLTPDDSCPVNHLWRNDMVQFCNWLSQQEGRRPCYRSDPVRPDPQADRWQCDFQANGYRLPTEAEWVHAHRARATSKYFFGDDTRFLTSYAHVAAVQTAPGGSKLPNRWGLFDMSGNVWEVCEDYYHQSDLPPGLFFDWKGPAGPSKANPGLRVARGGAYDSGSYDTGRDFRFRNGGLGHTTGFRVVCPASAAAGVAGVREEVRLQIEGYSAGLALQPDNLKFLRGRAELRVRLGHWKEAADDLHRVTERDPLADADWFCRAVLLLRAGDEMGYRQHCRQMRQHFAGSKEPFTADKVVKACLLLPATGDDLVEADRLSEAALKDLGPLDGKRKYLEVARGIALYRAGKWSDAATLLKRSQQSPPSQRPHRQVRAQAALFESMSLWQLKQPEQARAALAKGVALVEKDLAALREGAEDRNWSDLLYCDILLHEARKLVRPPS